MSQHDNHRFGSKSIDHSAPAVERRSSIPPAIAAAQDTLEDLADRYGVPAVDLTQIAILLTDLDVLPREIAERHLMLPLSIRDDRMLVAMANPSDTRAIDELEFVTGKRLSAYVAPPRLLTRVLDAAYQAKSRGAKHYTGPNCPAHVLNRLGMTTSSPPPRSPSMPPPGPAPRARTQSTLEAKGRGLTNELSEDGFGTLSADLSTVTDLSALGRLAQAGDASLPSQKATVLVVDEDVENRRMLARILTERGYRVLQADRGLTALRLVKEQMPGLIVLDAMLPEVHGFDIARRIKGSRKYGHIPIVMMSAVHRGWRYAEDIKTTCGVAEYVEKPFRVGDMMEAIERARSAADSTHGQGEAEDSVSADAERALHDGIAAFKAGDIETAIAHLKQGVEIDPLAYRLHFHLGLVLGKRGRVYEAIHALETAIGINPRHFPALKNLAVLYEQASFRNKAIETWERALGAAPDEDTRLSIKEYLMELL